MESRLIRPEDDYFHERTDHPDWNESGWFGFNDPERELNGWVYMYHRPNMKYTVAGVAVWDPSGEYPWDCLFYDWNDTMPLAPDANMFDFQAVNSFSAKCVEPLKKLEFGYGSEGCELDLTWTAVREPQFSGQPPEGGGEWGPDHFEQIGRMTGTVKLESLGGEELEINSFSMRDHTWGERRVTPKLPRGDFPTGIASEDNAFVATVAYTDPPETDPVDGATERIVTGWYLKDGEIAGMYSGTRNVAERGEDGRPKLVILEGKDELGRDLYAEGRCVNWLYWPGYPHFFQWWSLIRWEFDGVVGYGDLFDWFPARRMRSWTRSRKQVPVAT